jgi:carotenoid cleavage dioxygenase
MQEMSKTLKSLSSNLLERFIDTAYRFSEQHSLNEVNIKMIFFLFALFLTRIFP